jgi:hypothetical protein
MDYVDDPLPADFDLVFVRVWRANGSVLLPCRKHPEGMEGIAVQFSACCGGVMVSP